MEKILYKHYFEVWFSDGYKYWSYDLHDVFNQIRFRRPVEEKMTCLVQIRCEYINSVITPLISHHELKFNH